MADSVTTAADSCLSQLATYLGSVLVGALIPLLLRNKKGYQRAPEVEEISMDTMGTEIHNSIEGPVPHRSIIKLAILDVIGNFCVTVGFSMIGSGMYQVIYSSVVIWCAILNFLFMNRHISKLQWVAIFGSSAGLAISSLDSMNSSSVWIFSYTLPRLDELINLSPNTNPQTVWAMYALVIIANAMHSWNYYELIDRTGSVATGILQGLRAVLVYGLSHIRRNFTKDLDQRS
ncbi:hypothetical protein DFQ30_003525 [Apophysomyces sp. BC1015]|nr:hypothetical protein DFQ30_003525 [Apophysomyces sp. BC1015]